ncbi:hypothetical protein [Streptomyces sp. 2A115]
MVHAAGHAKVADNVSQDGTDVLRSSAGKNGETAERWMTYTI